MAYKKNVERERDLLWEAVCDACQIDGLEVTPAHRAKINAALKELRAADADPYDVPRRAREYQRKYPHAALTPSALAAHWAEFSRTRWRPRPRVELVDDDMTPETTREESRKAYEELRAQGVLPMFGNGGDAA